VSWVVYALQNGDPALLRVNAIGCGFAVFYLAIFLSYSKGEALRKLFFFLGAVLAVGGGLWAGISLGVIDKDTRISALGAVAVACNVALYAAPIKVIRQAFMEMNPTLIPALLTFVSTILSACWMVYGFLVSNPFVWGPNVAGTFLCVAQLLVVGYVQVRVSRDPSLNKSGSANKQLFDGDDDEAAMDEGRAGLLVNAGDGAPLESFSSL
jgi:hypothetical protein